MMPKLMTGLALRVQLDQGAKWNMKLFLRWLPTSHGYTTETEVNPPYRATAIPATARRPTATEPTFLLAPPVKPEDDVPADNPVLDGATGVIGEPVALTLDTAVPTTVPTAVPTVVPTAVAVAKPVEPATTDELYRCQSSNTVR